MGCGANAEINRKYLSMRAMFGANAGATQDDPGQRV